MSMCYWCRRNTYCQAVEKALYKAVNDNVMYCDIFNPVALPPISMGRTSPPWVNKEKAVTRRNWMTSTARKFQNDTYYMAWSRQRQFGGEPIGIGKITGDPFRQHTSMMVDDDYVREGFEFLDRKYGKKVLWDAFIRWEQSRQILTVVPFEVLEVFPGMQKKYSTDDEIVKVVNALLRELP